MKKMLERQLASLPPEQKEKAMKAIAENPELFEKIAKELQEKMAEGKDQMAAAMEILPKYQNELKKFF